MTQATGAKSKVLMGFQSDIGTLAMDGVFIGINSSGLKGARNQHTPATIRGNLNPSEPFDGNKSVSGSIVVPVDSLQFWYLLKAAFGDPVTTGSESLWDHTFKAGNDRPYLTFEHQFLDLTSPKYFQYSGCRINGFSFSAGDDGELTASFDVVGSDRIIASNSFDPDAVASSFARLKNNQLSLKEGGSDIGNAKLVDVSINFNCDTSQYVIKGGGVLGNIPDGVMGVSGNLNAIFADTSLLDKAVNSTQSSIEMTFDGGVSSKLAVKLPELKYAPNDPGIDGPQGIAIALPFNAYYENSVDTTSVVVTLTNNEEHA
ncbi:MAG: hypothetical protein GY710_17305 [Desulfobacteraceae bacterium]|nr:hypothetical protein [Desulfobacteraceae bacterium]